MGDVAKQKLLSIKKKLDKALASDDFAEAQSVLSSISSVKVTSELVTETKLKLLVTKLCKHQDSDLSTAAKSIVSDWQGSIFSPSRAKPSSTTKTSSKNAASPILTSSSTPALRRSGSSTPPLKPTASTPNLRTSASQLHPSSASKEDKRQRVESLFLTALTNRGADSNPLIPEIAADIEVALYDSCKHDCNAPTYVARARELASFMKREWLRDQIVSGQFAPVDLISASNEELSSPEERSARNEVRRKMAEQSQVPGDDGAPTCMFTCGKCKGTRCSYRELQTRSADEPMTVFLRCLDCGNRWKQY